MAHLLPNPKMQFLDVNGDPLSGGKVNTYEAGTSTPKATYTTAAATVPNANPVILDSRGEANIFWSTGSYKITVTDSADAEIYTVDAITLSATGAAGSSFRAGSGAPSDSLGADGDRYLNTDTGGIYVKDEGSYTLESTLAFPASAVVNTPSGNLAATDVQAALNELQSDVDGRQASGTYITPSTGNTFDDGIVGTPSIGFASDPDSGLYKTAANGVGVSTGGYLGLEVKKSTGNFGNVGMGSTPSTSDSYPLLISRSNASAGTTIQIANPSTAANSKGSVQVSTDAGGVQGELSAYPAASSVFAYVSALVLRCTDSAVKTVIGATQYISFHANNTLTAAGEALRINADYSLSFMQQIATPTTPASNTMKLYQKTDDKLYMINDAGTEQALNPMTAVGDLVLGGTAGAPSRLAIGANNYYLKSNGTTASWAAASGGGGGGIAVNWADDYANSAQKTNIGFLKVYEFEAGLDQSIYAVINVPSTYEAGSPITMLVKAVSEDTSGNFLLSTNTILVRSEVDEYDDTTNAEGSTNSAITMSSSNDREPQKITLILSDASGEVNGVAVSPEDILIVRLYRNTDTATGSVYLISGSEEVTIS